jgi:hypothetical protein
MFFAEVGVSDPGRAGSYATLQAPAFQRLRVLNR